MNVLTATKTLTLKLLILYCVNFTSILKTISFIYQGQGKGNLGEGQWLEFQASELGRDLWVALWVASKRANQL